MANNNTVTILVVLAVIVGGYLFLGGQIPSGQTQAVSVNPNQVGAPTPKTVEFCSSSTTPELKTTFHDSINLGTQVTDLNVALYLNGQLSVPRQTLSSDDTFDASPGDSYVMYVTDDTNQAYFGKILTGTVECDELQSLNENIDTRGSFNITVYNNDDVTANVADTPQAIGSGESVSLRLRIKENTADAWFSPLNSNAPAPIVLIDTNFSGPIDSVKPSGNYKVATVPVGIATDTNGTSTKAYELTDLAGMKDFQFKDITFSVAAKSGSNPNLGSVSFRFISPQLVQNSDTGDWVWDYTNPVSGATLNPIYQARAYFS